MYQTIFDLESWLNLEQHEGDITAIRDGRMCGLKTFGVCGFQAFKIWTALNGFLASARK